jgi:hypothetical protein
LPTLHLLMPHLPLLFTSLPPLPFHLQGEDSIVSSRILVSLLSWLVCHWMWYLCIQVEKVTILYRCTRVLRKDVREFYKWTP